MYALSKLNSTLKDRKRVDIESQAERETESGAVVIPEPEGEPVAYLRQWGAVLVDRIGDQLCTKQVVSAIFVALAAGVALCSYHRIDTIK